MSTSDEQDERRRAGRPRKWASEAERARAYRQRKAAEHADVDGLRAERQALKRQLRDALRGRQQAEVARDRAVVRAGALEAGLERAREELRRAEAEIARLRSRVEDLAAGRSQQVVEAAPEPRMSRSQRRALEREQRKRRG